MAEDKNIEIQLSSEFKFQTTKAIIAIAFFALTYVIILLFAVGLTISCIVGAVYIITLMPKFTTVVIGIGLASLGLLITIFILISLLKFIFKSCKAKANNSHLIEINKADEPDLFNMINEIVKEVGTNFPKKIYLSTDVDAAVFYESNFWSMFFPIKKNLVIGLGLVNTVTKTELKAILSHEFGHFSQRTMKIGSYVNNVNQIIFNVLYDNESYKNISQQWANIFDGYFSIFVRIADKITEGIQWILRKLYDVVNMSYLGLSREMEFYADEIAANVTGYEPLKSSLLRMSLAYFSFDNVLNFYNDKVPENIKSENLYTDQTVVLKFLAEINKIPNKNSFPEISLEMQSKFDKSKLVIKDLWASHPTVKERVNRLENTGLSFQNEIDTPANSLFKNIEKTQRQLTEKLFESVTYKEETTFLSSDNFEKEYKNKALSNSFAEMYNGYYDSKHPAYIELNSNAAENDISFHELFSDGKVDLVCTAIALQNDMATLENILNNSIQVRTFDYDGVRYKRENINDLLKKLEIELEKLNEQINKNDTNIYEYFRKIENEQNKSNELKLLYNQFFEFDKAFDSKYGTYPKLLNELQFVEVTTPFEQIKINLSNIKPIEENLKTEINKILSDGVYQTEITNEIRQNLEQYVSKEWEYFDYVTNRYNEDNLSILYAAMSNYAYLLPRGYFLMKKRILAYQEELRDAR